MPSLKSVPSFKDKYTGRMPTIDPKDPLDKFRIIDKHGTPRSMDHLSGHWTISGSLPYDKMPLMKYEGCARVKLSMIIMDWYFCAIKVPAELSALPICGIAGCVKPEHLRFMTIGEIRQFVNCGKVEKARKLRLRLEYMRSVVHELKMNGKLETMKGRQQQQLFFNLEYDCDIAEARAENMSAKEELAEAVRIQLLHHLIIKVTERTDALWEQARNKK